MFNRSPAAAPAGAFAPKPAAANTENDIQRATRLKLDAQAASQRAAEPASGNVGNDEAAQNAAENERMVAESENHMALLNGSLRLNKRLEGIASGEIEVSAEQLRAPNKLRPEIMETRPANKPVVWKPGQ